MDGNLVAFYILAVVAVGSALGMLFSKNAVYSALFLIFNFATVAVYYLMLGAPFIAMAQVTVYAGAIMVLFLFVIMLLGAEKLAGEDTLVWQKPLAGLLTVFLAFDIGYWVWFRDFSDKRVASFVEGFGTPEGIGQVLFNEYLLPFEVTSVLLLAAMIGAIVLTKEKRRARKKS